MEGEGLMKKGGSFGPAIGPTHGYKTTKPRRYLGLFSCAGRI
jgi:hypothetical protein